jgi:uncharacterized membrane protein YqiK
VVKRKEEVMNGKGLNDMRGAVHIVLIIVIVVIIVLLLLFVLHAGPWARPASSSTTPLV